MSEVRSRHPSPAVYRRRRLVAVLLVLAVILAVIWLLVAQPWRGVAAERALPTVTATSAATTLPAPSASATVATIAPTADAGASTATPSSSGTESTPPPEPAPIATPVAAVCTAKNVTVDAVTDQSTYPSGQLPKLSIRLTNHGSADCTLNVGTTQQVLTVTSGSDTWWRSTDCQTAPSDMVVLIAAGQTVSSAQPVEWDRTRSSVSSCGGDRPRAPAGGASYHLKVSIGGIASSGSAQFLLY